MSAGSPPVPALPAWKVLGVLSLYFLAHLVARTLSSDSLQLDEAEQILLAGKWRLGYGSQPPLYTWLQQGFFQVFGPTVFALAALKNLLLFGIFLVSFEVARRVFQSPEAPQVAVAVLALFPGLVWESQRDQSHLVLATFLAIGLFLAFLRAWHSPSPGAYALLGAVAGLGVLAKYNHAFLLAALLLAAATTPATRPVVANRRMLLAAAAFVLVTAPHLHWALTHQELALSQSHKFKIAAGGQAHAWGTGLFELCAGILASAAAPLLLLACVWGRDLRTSPPSSQTPPAVRLASRTLLVGLALAAVTVLAFQVTEIKARWLQPLLILMPLPLIDRVESRLTARRFRILLGLAGTALVAVLLSLHGSVWLVRWTGRPTNLNLPYAAWAADIRRAGFTHGPIVVTHLGMAGNLRHQFPSATILTPELHPAPFTSDQPLLVVWKPTRPNAIVTNALDYCEQLTGRRPDPAAIRFTEARLLHHPTRTAQLGYAIVPAPPPPPPTLP